MEVAAVALNCMAKIVQVHCVGGHTPAPLSGTLLGHRYRDFSHPHNLLKIWKWYELLEKGEGLGMGEEKNCVILQLGSWLWNTK